MFSYTCAALRGRGVGRIVTRLSLVFAVLCSAAAGAQDTIVHLERRGDATRLIVDGEPFLVRGGELGNSSAASAEYMKPIWPRLKAMNLNTVLAPVYWELIEPREGAFDFRQVEHLIDSARDHDMKLVLLWFASWKNSMSSYVPGWVKLDQARFPRAKDEDGINQEILTAFSPANLRADRKAFVRLMQYLKDYDEDEQTVIMVQVENEIGMLPGARDHHPLADAAFESPVPQALIDYLESSEDRLVPEFASRWGKANKKPDNDWEAMFGESADTDELFMAWHYARYANEIVEAGKAVYPLPMFFNAALNRPGEKPGEGYPSGGPLPHLMDVWKAGAPAVDFLSPDFYTPRFQHWNDLYARRGNPLFIPEHRFDGTVAAKAAFAFGRYEAIGFAPFSIENGSKGDSESLAAMYDLVRQMAPVITEHQGRDAIEGVLFDHEQTQTVLRMGEYRFTCRHDYTLGWSPGASEEQWPSTSAIIVQTGDNEFFVAGTGLVITFDRVDDSGARTGLLSVDRGRFEDGQWRPGLRLNGDQTHQGRHVRIQVDEYAIQHVKLYTY